MYQNETSDYLVNERGMFFTELHQDYVTVFAAEIFRRPHEENVSTSRSYPLLLSLLKHRVIIGGYNNLVRNIGWKKRCLQLRINNMNFVNRSSKNLFYSTSDNYDWTIA